VGAEVRTSKGQGQMRIWLTRTSFLVFSLCALTPLFAAGDQPTAARAFSRFSGHSSLGDSVVLDRAVPYADCTGASPLGHDNVYRDVCVPGVYLLAHNPGPFGALTSSRVGSVIAYAGRRFTITSVSLETPQQAWHDALTHPAAMTLHTCANASGTLVWVYRAS
jgi:hypothetical protein